MMTVDCAPVNKQLQKFPTSPLHLHVDERTPVHVHISKNNSLFEIGANQTPSVTASKSKTSHSTSKQQVIQKNLGKGPWIPPPARTTRGVKEHHTFLGKEEESMSPISSTNRHNEHGDSDAEKNYESHSKFYVLQPEFASSSEDIKQGQPSEWMSPTPGVMEHGEELRSTVNSFFSRTTSANPKTTHSSPSQNGITDAKQRLDQQETALANSKQCLAEAERLLVSAKTSLDQSEKEKQLLEMSVNFLKRESDLHKMEKAQLISNRTQLMDQLVSTEREAAYAVEKVAALRRALFDLHKNFPNVESTPQMPAQNQRLMNVLAQLPGYETSVPPRIQSPPPILRNRQRTPSPVRHRTISPDTGNRISTDCFVDDSRKRHHSASPSKQRDKGRIADSFLKGGSYKERYGAGADLDDKDSKSVRTVISKDDCYRYERNSKCTQSHQQEDSILFINLQKQLRSREAEFNRAQAQLKCVQSELDKSKVQVNELKNSLKKVQDDKDMLKKATRTHKYRSQKTEEECNELKKLLNEKENYVADLQNELENLNKIESPPRISREEEIEAQLMSQRTTYQEQLESLKSHINHVDSENQSLKKLLREEQERNQILEEDLDHLSKNQETLKNQSKEEKDRLKKHIEDIDRKLQSREKDMEISRKRDDKMESKKFQQLHAHLQQQVDSLNPLPELLRATEISLQDASYANKMLHDRIADLNKKVDSQTEQIQRLQDKCDKLNDEKQKLQKELEESKGKSSKYHESINRLKAELASKEKYIHQMQGRMEEKIKEVATLLQQQEALKEKALAVERTSSLRIADMEREMSRSKAETARLQRDKEQADRRNSSKIAELQNKVELCHDQNRSMQSYVDYLKSSYSSIFSEAVNVQASTPNQTLPSPRIMGDTTGLLGFLSDIPPVHSPDEMD